jgi:hypothetical protein
VHCADDHGGGFNGRITFVAAGGELLATYTFHTVSKTPTLLTLQMTGHFVPGGTGRFASASGSFVASVYAHTTTVPPTAETIWPLELAFEGTLGGWTETTALAD